MLIELNCPKCETTFEANPFKVEYTCCPKCDLPFEWECSMENWWAEWEQ